MNALNILSRRMMLKGAALATAAGALASLPAIAADAPGGTDSWRGLKIGVASYTFRKLPLDAAIKAIQKTGLKYVSIKDFHMPMQMSLPQRQEVVKKFRDA